jgi:4-amino-4-deoxy-L-arabinose transferase-like glycosyltransferase
MDDASAWHLVNFFSFILGVYFLYRLGTRFTTRGLATVNAAFFALQPLLWGHAFINPKDMPFMTAFLAAVTLGLEWVDSIPERRTQSVVEGWFWRILHTPAFPKLFLATLALGIASAIRVIGPLAGALVFVYFLIAFMRLPSTARAFALIHLSAYALFSAVLMFALWPFLWADPIHRLLEVLRHMSNNPTELAVLFRAEVFRANELPARYFPQMLALTLTEPFLPLALIGGLRLAWQVAKKQRDWAAPLVLFLWFVPLAAYNILKVPSMYDGIRHFLFLLPPLFILAGIGIAAVPGVMSQVSGVRRFAFHTLLAALLLLPGITGILRLHPYQYTYYNSLVGPTYRVYENDYWLTCYKEAVEWVHENEADRPLYIQREFAVAAYYGEGLDLRDLRYETIESLPDDALMLFSTRANLDQRSVFRGMPVIHAIGRDNVEFCLLKRKE